MEGYNVATDWGADLLTLFFAEGIGDNVRLAFFQMHPRGADVTLEDYHEVGMVTRRVMTPDSDTGWETVALDTLSGLTYLEVFFELSDQGMLSVAGNSMVQEGPIFDWLAGGDNKI